MHQFYTARLLNVSSTFHAGASPSKRVVASKRRAMPRTFGMVDQLRSHSVQAKGEFINVGKKPVGTGVPAMAFVGDRESGIVIDNRTPSRRSISVGEFFRSRER